MIGVELGCGAGFENPNTSTVFEKRKENVDSRRGDSRRSQRRKGWRRLDGFSRACSQKRALMDLDSL